MNAQTQTAEQLPARCGALNKNGSRCTLRPGPNGWTCTRHEGWIDTANDEERHQLAWLEISELLECLAEAPADGPETAWRTARLVQAEGLLSRLMDQERIRHRGDFDGSALEGDVADALRLCFALRFGRRALENFDTVRQAHPTGTGFDPNCRCSTCREMQAAELVPHLPPVSVGDAHAECHCSECAAIRSGRMHGPLAPHEVPDPYPYVTFRAWLTAGSDKELRYLQAPKRAAALQLASLAGQAQHIRDQYPELARQVEHENKSRRRP